jgi:hypothetical protein
MDWKRWLRRTVGIIVFVVVVRTVWLVGERQWRWNRGQRAFAEMVSETDRIDPDWRWETLAAKRRKPPGDKNSAEVVTQAYALLPTDWTRFDNPTKWEPDSVPSAPNVQHPAEAIAQLRMELPHARGATECARRLKDYPDGHTDIVLEPDVWSTKLGHVDRSRKVALLLKWDAVLAIADRDNARAADDLLALLNTSRAIGDDPFLVSQLARIASRVIAGQTLEWALAQSELPDAWLAALQSAWVTDAEEPLLLFGLRGERAVNDVMLGTLLDGTYQPAGEVRNAVGTSVDGYFWWLYRARFWNDRVYLHQYFSCAVELARRPVHEQRTALNDLPALPSDDLRIAQLFVPAVEKVATAHWRTTAEARCTAVGVACERFRLKTGHWPNAPTDLTTDILPGGIPLDPFDGKPLRFGRLADGVVIYSVGQDSLDDGGAIARTGPYPAGTDVGFRLWDLDHRHKPAPARPEPAVGAEDDQP